MKKQSGAIHSTCKNKGSYQDSNGVKILLLVNLAINGFLFISKRIIRNYQVIDWRAKHTIISGDSIRYREYLDMKWLFSFFLFRLSDVAATGPKSFYYTNSFRNRDGGVFQKVRTDHFVH